MIRSMVWVVLLTFLFYDLSTGYFHSSLIFIFVSYKCQNITKRNKEQLSQELPNEFLVIEKIKMLLWSTAFEGGVVILIVCTCIQNKM